MHNLKSVQENKTHKLLWDFEIKTDPLISTRRQVLGRVNIIIIIMSRRQHGYPWPSLATSPYHSSPPASLQGYILCPHIVAVCKFVLVVLLLHIQYVGVHRSTSLMSSSLLLQQCPACLVRLTCIVFVMGGKCPYSWSLVGCCRQDLFNNNKKNLPNRGLCRLSRLLNENKRKRTEI